MLRPRFAHPAKNAREYGDRLLGRFLVGRRLSLPPSQ
jgi:hypothetical protein